MQTSLNLDTSNLGMDLEAKRNGSLMTVMQKEFLAKIKNKKKAESTLWCYSQAPTSSNGQNKRESSKRSRSRSPITKSGSSRYDAHITKMSKVNEIYKKIHEAHGNLYSPEQKRAHDRAGET